MKRLVFVLVFALLVALTTALPAAGVQPCVRAQVEGYWASACSPISVNRMMCLTWYLTSPYVQVDVCVPTELPPP